MRRFCLPLTILTIALAGCAQFPELDQTVTPQQEAADYPALVRLDPLIAQAHAGQINAPVVEANLSARLDRLRARAARLRGSVLSGAEKQRLRQGLR